MNTKYISFTFNIFQHSNILDPVFLLLMHHIKIVLVLEWQPDQIAGTETDDIAHFWNVD